MYEKILSFNTEVGVHCEMSSVSNVLANISLNDYLNQEIVFFLQNGFKTDFYINNVEYISEIVLSNHMERVFKDFLSLYKIEYSYKNYNWDISRFICDTKQNVKKNKPSVLVVDTRFLNHSTVFKDNIRRKHNVVILGVCDEGFIFNDCYVPTSPVTSYEGIMDFNTMKVAWESTNKMYININLDKFKSTKFNIDTAVIVNSIKSNLRDFILMERSLDRNNNLYEFSECISRLNQLFPEKEIKDNIWELGFKIQFDSVMPSRKLLKRILSKLIDSENAEKNFKHIHELDLLLNRWHNIAYLIIRAGLRLKEDSFNKISILIKNVLNDEIVLFENIIKYLNCFENKEVKYVNY